MRDLKNNIGVLQALAPAVFTAAAVGPVLDLLGFGSAAIAVTTGAIEADGDFAVSLQESDDGAAFTDVAATDMEGSFPASLAEAITVKVGYRGNGRYLRLALAKTGGTSIAVSAVLITGNACERPVS
ncbi:hypothetical protein FJU08_16510 [Martelella alba]|uniref:Uncharacterized protein n=1 Tax=Martelella alba TaxID=2590451 RepID=A0A506U3L1_9HYPH|nr:hypothetical protein [Martelella alba]TPW28922.1 hypothetical protein FJU08_16510 [Martelella alba]